MSSSGWAGRFLFLLGWFAWAGFVFAQQGVKDFPLSGAWGSQVELCLFFGVVANENNLALVCDDSLSQTFISPAEYLPSVVDYLTILAPAKGFCYRSSNGFLIAASTASPLCADDSGGVVGLPGNSDGSLDAVLASLGEDADQENQVTLSQDSQVQNSEDAQPSQEFEPVAVRLRVVEFAENSGITAGLELRSQAFSDLVAYAFGDGFAAYRLLTSELVDSLRLAESSGVGRKLDDISVTGVVGIPLLFQAGGNINVNLVGAGQENISAVYAYGLNLGVTVTKQADSYVLDYNLQSSAPVSASDPELITLASRSVSSKVMVGCAESVVIAGFRQDYQDTTGSGLPGLGSLPGLGYAFASANVTETRTTLLLTLELVCDA